MRHSRLSIDYKTWAFSVSRMKQVQHLGFLVDNLVSKLSGKKGNFP